MYQLNADPEVMRFVPDEPFVDVAEARDFLAAYDAYERYGFGRWAMISMTDQACLGWCGLNYNPTHCQVDLGFRLHRQFWGQGYATEAALASIKWGFSARLLSKIIGRTARGNLASRRVLEKVGMALTGTFEELDWSGLEYSILCTPAGVESFG